MIGRSHGCASHTNACPASSAAASIPAAYLVPDATRPGGGGQDVERRPAMFCREHLEEMLGHPPEEQPVFRRVEGPGE